MGSLPGISYVKTQWEQRRRVVIASAAAAGVASLGLAIAYYRWSRGANAQAWKLPPMSHLPGNPIQQSVNGLNPHILLRVRAASPCEVTLKQFLSDLEAVEELENWLEFRLDEYLTNFAMKVRADAPDVSKGWTDKDWFDWLERREWQPNMAGYEEWQYLCRDLHYWRWVRLGFNELDDGRQTMDKFLLMESTRALSKKYPTSVLDQAIEQITPRMLNDEYSGRLHSLPPNCMHFSTDSLNPPDPIKMNPSTKGATLLQFLNDEEAVESLEEYLSCMEVEYAMDFVLKVRPYAPPGCDDWNEARWIKWLQERQWQPGTMEHKQWEYLRCDVELRPDDNTLGLLFEEFGPGFKRAIVFERDQVVRSLLERYSPEVLDQAVEQILERLVRAKELPQTLPPTYVSFAQRFPE